MISRACAVLTLVTLALFAQSVQSQEPRPARNRPLGTETRRAGSPSPLLEALDTNHDGKLDAEEIASASSGLAALDKNDDGELTEDEYLPAPAAAATRAARRFPPRPRFAPTTSPAPQGGLENFGRVDDRLFRGARPSATGLQTLKALGVTTVIDLTMPDQTGEAERAEAERNGLVYLNLPMESLARPTPAQVTVILSAIRDLPGPIFVHCQAGKDRTGTIVACYRMTECQWTGEHAQKEADQFRMAAMALPMKAFIADFANAQSQRDAGQ